MKRLGIVEGAISCFWLLGFACCGGRTDSGWGDLQSGGKATGGEATGGRPVTPNTGGTGATPASGGKGGTGTGGKVSPTTGGMLGTGGVTGCVAGHSSCANTCVNLQTNSSNCGACGRSCKDSSCSDGVCISMCSPGWLRCRASCIDPSTDPRFCGAIGTCDGPQSGQVCAAAETCHQGRCEAFPRSCLDLLERGKSFGDNYYEIAPGPNPAQAEKVYCDMTQHGGGWTRCFELRNTLNEDLLGNNWFDRCVDWTSAGWSRAELLVELKDANGVLVYAASGWRDTPWSYDTLTSTAEPNGQASPTVHDLIKLSNSDLLWITGRSSSNQGCFGARGNGYGVLITPSPAVAEDRLRLLVMPYRLQVGSQAPRQFGFDNLQWFPEHEISFGAMAPFSTCEAPIPFLGSFEFYVR